MDDFRMQLTAVIDAMREAGSEPSFLVVDLDGIEFIKKTHGDESVARFREAATGAISNAAGGCDTFRYGDERIVAILGGFSRLRTFALIEKLRRMLPLLGQSFDCALRPEFDVLDLDEQGVAGLVAQLAKLTRDREAAA
jgi:GGDEF domain-containing protein